MREPKPTANINGSGVLISEPDGRVWLVKPTNEFGGYRYTFPKGKLDKGLTLRDNAIKEALEETGLLVKIIGYAGDFAGDTGTTRYYHAKRIGGSPLNYGWETEAVVLVPRCELDQYLNRTRDKNIAAQHLNFQEK